MTNQQHPITPPPELVQQWLEKARREIGAIKYNPMETFHYIATQAARWGADQELEACCEWLDSKGSPNASRLRAARRPKPPSLKEQALSLIPEVCGLPMMRTYSPDELLVLRRALEALPE